MLAEHIHIHWKKKELFIPFCIIFSVLHFVFDIDFYLLPFYTIHPRSDIHFTVFFRCIYVTYLLYTIRKRLHGLKEYNIAGLFDLPSQVIHASLLLFVAINKLVTLKLDNKERLSPLNQKRKISPFERRFCGLFLLRNLQNLDCIGSQLNSICYHSSIDNSHKMLDRNCANNRHG